MNHFVDDNNTNKNNVDVNASNHSPPKEIDRSVYDVLIDQNMYLDMKSKQLSNWDNPTWKNAAYVPKKRWLYTTDEVSSLCICFYQENPSCQDSRHPCKSIWWEIRGKSMHESNIRKEITKVFLNKILMKKPPIVDIELLPINLVKQKMVLSGSWSTSSTATKR